MHSGAPFLSSVLPAHHGTQSVCPLCTDKGANYSSYSNEKVDEYLSLARQSDDPEVRKEYYGKFQEELAEDPAYAFICYIDANYVADSGIQGISKDTVLGHHGVGIFWNIQDWTMTE